MAERNKSEYMSSKPSTRIYIDTTHPRQDGTCAVSIRLTHHRIKRYFSTGIRMRPDDFRKAMGNKPRKELKTIALKLQSFEKKAADVIQNLPVFTWEAFEKKYRTDRAARDIVSQALLEYAREIRKRGQISTASSYECAAASLEKFRPQCRFVDLTSDTLREYEKWMVDAGNSPTTVGIYLRNVRATFNLAISEGTLSKEYYPFGKRKYEIPTTNKVKKALNLEEVAKIYNYVPCSAVEQRVKDYWMFMYLCNGINVKDVCLLKYSDIQQGIIEFERAKTARTKRNIEKIRVPLTADLERIIERQGVKRRDIDTYIFPILAKGLTAERQRHLIQLFTRYLNDNLRKLAASVSIDKRLTTYTARHTFATILMRHGISAEFISEALGHSSVNTTHRYLNGFEDDAKVEAAKALTAFKTA